MHGCDLCCVSSSLMCAVAAGAQSVLSIGENNTSSIFPQKKESPLFMWLRRNPHTRPTPTQSQQCWAKWRRANPNCNFGFVQTLLCNKSGKRVLFSRRRSLQRPIYCNRYGHMLQGTTSHRRFGKLYEAWTALFGKANKSTV